MSSLEANGVTRQNREIISFATKSNPLTQEQIAQLEAFSMLDDEWRMLMVIGDHYAGMDERAADVNTQREMQINSNLDPILGTAIRKYLQLIEVAQFENEP